VTTPGESVGTSQAVGDMVDARNVARLGLDKIQLYICARRNWVARVLVQIADAVSGDARCLWRQEHEEELTICAIYCERASQHFGKRAPCGLSIYVHWNAVFCASSRPRRKKSTATGISSVARGGIGSGYIKQYSGVA